VTLLGRLGDGAAEVAGTADDGHGQLLGVEVDAEARGQRRECGTVGLPFDEDGDGSGHAPIVTDTDPRTAVRCTTQPDEQG